MPNASSAGWGASGNVGNGSGASNGGVYSSSGTGAYGDSNSWSGAGSSSNPMAYASNSGTRAQAGTAGAWGSRATDAAQFMPFAALTGFEELTYAQENEPERRRTVTEEHAEEISRMLVRLRKGDIVQVTHYEYSRYVTSAGAVRQVDSTFRRLVLVGEGAQPDRRILFEDIWELRCL
jgi:hypothetical protein